MSNTFAPQLVAIADSKGKLKNYAAGLAWRHEETNPSAATLKELVKTHGRFGVIRKTVTSAIQLGFYGDEALKAKDVKSLADCVADSRGQPWRGAYQLDDGRFWYIAVRDQQEIVPDGDQICTMDELVAIKSAHDNYGNWNEVSGDQKDLRDLIDASSSRKAIKDFSSRSIFQRPLLLSGLSIMLFALASGGAYFVKKQAQTEAEAQIARSVAGANAARQKTVADALSEKPWVGQPASNSLFKACGDVWSKQDIAVPGWALSKWACKKSKTGVLVDETWQRRDGIASGAPGVLDANGETSSRSTDVSVMLSPLDVARDGSVVPLRIGRISVWSVAHSHGLTLGMQDLPVRKVDPKDKNALPPQLWSSASVDMTTPFAPWMGFAAVADAVPGLRMASVSVDLSTDVWKMVGVLYGMDRPQGTATTTQQAAPASNPVSTTSIPSVTRSSAITAPAASAASTVKPRDQAIENAVSTASVASKTTATTTPASASKALDDVLKGVK